MDDREAKARRAAATREARRASLAWEGRVENALEAAKQSRIVADFVHTEPAFTRQGIPLERSVTDFVGALEGGLAIGIEAKSTKEHRFPFAKVSGRQVEYLDALWRGGSLAMLAIEFREDGTGILRQFMIPWGEVPWEKAISAKTLTLAGLAAAGISPMPQTSTIASFLWKCEGCGSYVPKASGRARNTCCRLMPPF